LSAGPPQLPVVQQQGLPKIKGHRRYLRQTSSFLHFIQVSKIETEADSLRVRESSECLDSFSCPELGSLIF
jgi:hypothetical protein